MTEQLEAYQGQRPKRVQRKRTKGYRTPPSIYVGRGTRWGNPFKVGDPGVPDRATAARLYRENVPGELVGAAKRKLRGRDLACYCPLDDACHADVLLELANEPTEGDR
jgi:hypothetical protein